MPNKYGFCRERPGDNPVIAIPFWAAAIIWFIRSYLVWKQPGQSVSLKNLFAFTGCIAVAIAMCQTGLGPMPAVIVLVLSTTWVFGRIAWRLAWLVYRAGRKKARPDLFVEAV